MPDPNTSATGGYLQQVGAPLEGVALNRFIHAVISLITGIDGTLVRPSWQINPAPVPSIETDWVAFGLMSRVADFDAYNEVNTNGLTTKQIRHETMEYLLSFYGLNCIGNACAFRDAVLIRQNQDVLYTEGMAIIGTSDITHAPELVNERWFDRCDVTMSIRREMRREYRVLSYTQAGDISFSITP